MTRLETLLAAQHALRDRFQDFFRAMQRENALAAGVALDDYERHLRRWTEAEEQALIPALERAALPGRNVRYELRLEYVQLRELTRFLLQQLQEGIRPSHLLGYTQNLARRLQAHEQQMSEVYYPAAAAELTEGEWQLLEAARPPS
ncbi:MAG TPA: hypothetical protein VH087_11605 [Thermoanaerobaculia bacterium]|nr:hypothetical protein [Thermoanaerobaculia bacterium]